MSTLSAEGKMYAALLLSDWNNRQMVEALTARLAEKRMVAELDDIVAGAKCMQTIVKSLLILLKKTVLILIFSGHDEERRAAFCAGHGDCVGCGDGWRWCVERGG